MSAPSGLRALSRGGGRGRARDGSQGRGGFQARAGSDDRVRDRTRLQPTRGGSMNNTQNSYAQRGQLIRGNRPTARNGPPPRRPSPAAKTNLEHNTPQRLDPRRAAGRHTVGLLRPVSSAPFTTTNTPRKANTPQKPIWRDPTKVSYTEYKDRMHELWTTLKKNREKERKDAIRDGFLADPDKPTSLANAITPVGTCKDMCPEFERVERIVQQMVDGAEKSTALPPILKVPNEDMMVKRFRRSAAGYDEQLPSDIRPPAVLKKTLDYLLRAVVGKNPLAQVHKFVWDRTRGIRNDFSIQQVTKIEDVKIAINCFERIARFHILSLHLLSHPHQDNGEFDQHQEREQLNNTLLSLMYYYDDNEGKITSYNEAEFRAYCLIFEIQDQRPDAEQRMSAWSPRLLFDEHVVLAYDLYNASCNTLNIRGPLRPQSPFAIAHENYSRFWAILKDPAVPYLMACTAEIHFNLVRAMALEILWKTYRRGNTKLDDWILADLMPVLGFDTEDQVATFCEEHGFKIGEREDGSAYLDISSVAGNELTDINPRRKQVWSYALVESKRMGRTIPGVIQGLSVSACKKIGQIEKAPKPPAKSRAGDGEQLFLSDDENEDSPKLKKPNGTSTPKKSSPVQTAKPASTTPATNPFQTTKPTSNPFQSIGNATQKAPLHNPFAALKNSAASSATLASTPFQTSAASSTFATSLTPGALNPYQITKPTTNPFPSITPAADTSKPSAASSDPLQTSAEDMGRHKTVKPMRSPFLTSTPAANPFGTSFASPASSTSTNPVPSVFEQLSGTGSLFGASTSSPATQPVPSVFGQPSGTNSVGVPTRSIATKSVPSVFSQPSGTGNIFGVPTSSPAIKPAPVVFGQPPATSNGATTFGQPSASASPFGSPSASSSSATSSMPLPSASPQSNHTQFNFSTSKPDFTKLATVTSEQGKSAFSSLHNAGQPKIIFNTSGPASPLAASAAPDAPKSAPTTSPSVFNIKPLPSSSTEQGLSVLSNLKKTGKQIFTFDTSAATGPPPEAVAAYEAYKDWKAPSTPVFTFATPAVSNKEQGTSAATAAGAITNGQAPGSDLFSRITKPESSDLASRITQPESPYLGSRIIEPPKSDLFSRITKPESPDLSACITQPENNDLGSRITQPPSSDLGSRIEQPRASNVDLASVQYGAVTTTDESLLQKPQNAPPSFQFSPQSKEPVQPTGLQPTPQSQPPTCNLPPQFITPPRTQTASTSNVDSPQPKSSPVLGATSATPTISNPTTAVHAPITSTSNANDNTQTSGQTTGPQLTPLAPQPDGVGEGGVPFVSVQQSQINAAKSGLRERVLDTLAHDLVCENDGYLSQYLQHSVDPIVIKAMAKVMRQEERQTVMIAREFLLSTKYGRKWRNITYKRALRRKGQDKRKRFAESMQEMARDAKRASNGPADFESPAEKRPRAMPPPPKPMASILKNQGLPNQTTKKRSAEETDDPRLSKKLNRSPPPSGNGRVKSHHKRSQTLGDLSHASGSAGTSQKQRLFFSPKSAKAVDAGLSIDAMREKARRMRIPLGPQDTTKTDYFLLKSHGLDPDTPLNPALRKRGAPEEDDIWAPSPKRISTLRSYRLSTQSAPSSGSRKRLASNEDEISAPSPKRVSPLREQTISTRPTTNGESSTTNAQTSNAVSTAAKDDDEALFAQVRQVREAMSESVSFYRDALRRSSSETEKEKKFREFKYTPSRSETRLKATGARGLLPKDWEFGSSAGNGSSIGKRRESDASFQEQSQSRDELHIPEQPYHGNLANMNTPTPALREMDFAALNNGSGSWTTGYNYPEPSYGNGSMGVGGGTGTSADDAIEL